MAGCLSYLNRHVRNNTNKSLLLGIKKMSYGSFGSVAEVARKFDIRVENQSFIEEKDIDVPQLYFNDIQQRLHDQINFINETTICERIIRPILDLVEIKYSLLKIWSHVAYHVDKAQGLVGEPDYLIAPRTRYGDMFTPPLCVIEAKQEKFDEGWTQALAEMVAASLQGSVICYAVVTTGKVWEFGKLETGVFIQDPLAISAVSELQRLCNLLNWLFDRANAVVENETGIN